MSKGLQLNNLTSVGEFLVVVVPFRFKLLRVVETGNTCARQINILQNIHAYVEYENVANFQNVAQWKHVLVDDLQRRWNSCYCRLV